jgi:hypothetical protein
MSDSDYDDDVADDWEVEAQQDAEKERRAQEEKEREKAKSKRQQVKVEEGSSPQVEVEISKAAKKAMEEAQRMAMSEQLAADLYSEQQKSVKFSDRNPESPQELERYARDLAIFALRYQTYTNFDKTLDTLFQSITKNSKADVLDRIIRSANIASESSKKKKASGTKAVDKKAAPTQAHLDLDNDDRGGAANADFNQF